MSDHRAPVPQTQFDPFDPQLSIDPYPVYARFRRQDPVHWGCASTPEYPGGWYLFRHDDIAKVLQSNSFSVDRNRRQSGMNRDAPTPDEQAYWHWIGQTISFRDPPDHTRMRDVVRDSFSPAGVRNFQPVIDSIVRRKLETLKQHDHLDVVEDIALQLPIEVLAGLIGREIDNADELRSLISRVGQGLDLRHSRELYRDARAATEELVDFFQRLMHLRKSQPQGDLLSTLVTAQQAGRLSHEEAISTIIFLLLAGSGSSTHYIAGAIFQLLSNPTARDLFRQEPSTHKRILEEAARISSPVQIISRLAIQDFEVGNKLIRSGDDVSLVLASANRDERLFKRGDEFNPWRRSTKQSAFGWGIHFCLGAALVRAETQTTARLFFDYFPNARAELEKARWTNMVAFRGLLSLPVEL